MVRLPGSRMVVAVDPDGCTVTPIARSRATSSRRRRQSASVRMGQERSSANMSIREFSDSSATNPRR